MWYVTWAVSWCFVLSVSWETSISLSTSMHASKEARNHQENMNAGASECKELVKRCGGRKENIELGKIILHQGNETAADPQQTSAIWQVPERHGCVEAL